MNGISLKLPRSNPSAEGLDANSVLCFLDSAQNNGIELHSLMIAVNGKVVTEGWWEPYVPGIRHGCYSGTKTFTATAIGFAIAEGRLELTDKLEKFFPEKLSPGQDENLHLLTIHDLLRMSCGQEQEVDIAQVPDAVSAFFNAKFPNKPGSVFKYNSVASHMLAEVVYRLTGNTLLEYLEPRLFAPLGITDVRWDRTPQGLSMGGWGIHLRTEDFLKMGMLFLQRGKWNGRQIVPENWVIHAGSRQIDNAVDGAKMEWAQGYCYQMWRNITPDSIRLDGAYGQFSTIYPRQNAVVTITSATQDTGKLMDLVRELIVPALTGKPMSQPDADSLLLERTAQLSLKETGNIGRGELESKLNGSKLIFEENTCSLIPVSQRYMAFLRDCGIQKAALKFFDHLCLFTWMEGNRNCTVKIGLEGNYAASELELPCADDPVLSVGCWQGSTFQFVIRAIEEPHSLQVRLTVQDNSVKLAYFDPLDPEVKWMECIGIIRPQ